MVPTTDSGHLSPEHPADVPNAPSVDEALRRSEERFRKLFNGHTACKLVIDPVTGRILDANPAAAAFYGWTVDELRAMRIQQINTLSGEDVQREMAAAATSERNYFEFRHRLADGSHRDVEVFSNRVEIDGQAVLYSIIHDVSQRHRLEAERERLIQDLETALEHVKTLRGIVPICAACKKIRDDQGYWEQVEAYMSRHTEANFSHGICPDCARAWYPEYATDPDDGQAGGSR